VAPARYGVGERAEPAKGLVADADDRPQPSCWAVPRSGADITEYFNYGFTEETWALYARRQLQLRAEAASGFRHVRNRPDGHEGRSHLLAHSP